MGFDANFAAGADSSGVKESLKSDNKSKPRDIISLEVLQPSGLAGFIEALRKENLARVLAESTLATVDRRPAFYRVGGELPPVPERGARGGTPKPRTFGTDFDFVPTKLSERRLKLELRARVADLDPKLDRIVDGQTVFGLREVAVDTGCEMEFGETMALYGLVQERTAPADDQAGNKDAPRELVATLLLLRPELVRGEPPKQSRQPAILR